MKRILLLTLTFFFAITMVIAQRTVSGRVTDENGEGLPGVNVLIKGTTTGTQTDLEGNFSLSVEDGATLVFSYVGFETQEVEVGSRTTIDLSMGGATELQEVVVTALGFEADPDKLGQATSSIGGNAVVSSGEGNLLDGMKGKAAGVNITSNSGDPGAGSRIVIRGATSITGSLQPLIVIDGVPMFNSQTYGDGSSSVAGVTQQSRMNDLNPDDIASMEVLKGASAAALWGSRGANGVIVITTKKGKSGRKDWEINITSRVSVDQLNKEVDLQYEYGQGIEGLYVGGFGAPSGMSLSWGDRIADRSGGADEFITNSADAGYLGYFESSDGDLYYAIPDGDYPTPHGGKNSRATYNPHDAIFQTGTAYFNSINAGTNDDNGSVFISFSNLNQRGVIKSNSNYIRNTARVNSTRYLTEWMSLSGNVSYSRTTSDRVQMGSNTSGLLLGGLRTPADFDMTDYTGTYYDVNGVPFPDRQRAYRNPLGRRTTSSYDNALWTIENNLSTTTVDRFIGKMELSLDPLPWLNVIGRIGMDTYTDKRDDLLDPASASSPGGYYSKEFITEKQVNADIIARANFTINQNINGNLLVGTNWNDRSFSNTGASIVNFINPLSPPDLGNAAADARSTIGGESFRRTVGHYFTASFGLFDQVFVNAGGRYDISSTLPENDNGFFYPSADVAWQFSKLIGDNNFLSFGKLRAAYGKVGREPGTYVTQTFFVGAGYTDGWGQSLDAAQYGGGFRQSLQAGNPNIKPETKTEVEMGADFRFIKNRIGIGATYYSNTTKDLIVARELPSSSGFSQTVANSAEIANKGIEIEWDANVYKSGDFSASLYGNWFRNRNEVVSIEGTSEISLAGFQGSTSSAVVGEQYGVIYGDATATNEDGTLDLDASGFPQFAPTPEVLGDPNPDWRGGFGTTLSFKGISLNVLFEHSQGGDIWNGTKGALGYFGRAGFTAHTSTLSASEATSVQNYFGLTAADMYPGYENVDGSYTIRGYITDFGGGPVLIDETYYWAGPGSGFTGPSDQFIEDATWTRLREVTLSYNLARIEAVKNLGLQSANFSFTGRNLLLWTGYTGVDPDTNLTGASNGFGLDYFNNPSTKSYIFTLNLTF